MSLLIGKRPSMKEYSYTYTVCGEVDRSSERKNVFHKDVDTESPYKIYKSGMWCISIYHKDHVEFFPCLGMDVWIL